MQNTRLISKEFLTQDMEIKVLKITDKGQISIPTQFQKLLNIHKGSNLIAVQQGDTIILQPVRESQFKDLVKHSETVAKKVWSNKKDEIWDKI